jgi:hypothetical protein
MVEFSTYDEGMENSNLPERESSQHSRPGPATATSRSATSPCSAKKHLKVGARGEIAIRVRAHQAEEM